MAAATSRFALANWSRMSRMIWFSIFSGFSAREMRSLMFDLITVDSFVKMPIRQPSASAPASARIRSMWPDAASSMDSMDA